MAVIGRWSKGPLLMTPIGWEADGRTGVRATVAVYDRTVVIREDKGPGGSKSTVNSPHLLLLVTYVQLHNYYHSTDL